MRVRQIDRDGDWTFGKGQNDYLTANRAIGQNVKTRLQSILGECFFNLQAGIDWLNLLGEKNELAIRLRVSAVILNTEGVTGLKTVNVVIDSDRHFTISYRIQTIYSPIEDQFSFDLNAIG